MSNNSTVVVCVIAGNDCNFLQHTNVHTKAVHTIIFEEILMPCNRIVLLELIANFVFGNQFIGKIETATAIFDDIRRKVNCLMLTGFILQHKDITLLVIINDFAIFGCINYKIGRQIKSDSFISTIGDKCRNCVLNRNDMLRLLNGHCSTNGVISSITQRIQKFTRRENVNILKIFTFILLDINVTTCRCNIRLHCKRTVNATVTIRRSTHTDNANHRRIIRTLFF